MAKMVRYTIDVILLFSLDYTTFGINTNILPSEGHIPKLIH